MSTSTFQILVEGVVDTQNNPVDSDLFLDKFIDFIESNNWTF